MRQATPLILLSCLALGCAAAEPVTPPAAASAIDVEALIDGYELHERLTDATTEARLFNGLDAPGMARFLELGVGGGQRAEKARSLLRDVLVDGPGGTPELRAREPVVHRLLMEAHGHPDPAVRVYVQAWIPALEMTAEQLPYAATAISAGVADPAPDVRAMAWRSALALVGPDQAGCVVFGPRRSDFRIEGLEAQAVAALEDPDRRVRERAVHALVVGNHPRCAELVLAHLASADRRDELARLVEPVAVMLAEMGKPPGEPEYDSPFFGDLGTAGEARMERNAAALLRPMLARPGHVRRNALLLLVRLADRYSFDPLPAWLREAAITVLIEDGDNLGLLDRADGAAIARAWRTMEELSDPQSHVERWPYFLAEELREIGARD
ncbi:MAG: hypothetical protein ACYTGX_10160 [Planctomycetota bacterium]|jgi:hypothetical protein